jgi:hypothetical protein
MFGPLTYEATLQAVGAASALIGIVSAFVGWLAWWDLGKDAAGIADAVGVGASIAFWPSVLLFFMVYVDVVQRTA